MSKERTRGQDQERPISEYASQSVRRALEPSMYASVVNLYSLLRNSNVYPVTPTDDSEWYNSMRSYADAQVQAGLTSALGQGAAQAELQQEPNLALTPVGGDDEMSPTYPSWKAELDSRLPDEPQSESPIYQQSPLNTVGQPDVIQAAQSAVEQEFAKVMAAGQLRPQAPEHN